MCKLAHVIRYTVLSQNFHFCCFRATTVKLSAVFVYLIQKSASSSMPIHNMQLPNQTFWLLLFCCC